MQLPHRTEWTPDAPSACLYAFANPGSFIKRAHRLIREVSNAAIEERGVFHCVLAGGRTPVTIYQALRRLRTNWSAWHFWFGDERCLAPGAPELNSVMADKALLKHVPVPITQTHRIPVELGARKAALAYREEIKDAPQFDLVLLGLGEDGHTASLFPGRDIGVEPSAPDVLSIFDAPKPPPGRVSISAQRLNRSRQMLFLVAGQHKKCVIDAIKCGALLPATALRGHEATTILFCEANR